MIFELFFYFSFPWERTKIQSNRHLKKAQATWEIAM
jgi:hypothetical protein